MNTMESDIINPALLKSIEGKKRELDALRPFSPEIVGKLEEQFTVEWTYNSNALEGNTLTLRETELVINRGLTVGNKTLQEHFVLELHKTILKNINDLEAGHYRNSNVMITGVAWYYEHKTQLSVVELAAWVHYKIVYIHPFIDGNGRTARLLMNLILIQNGYPPAVILHIDRKNIIEF